ncbi:MAG: tetratricopeptide repeat protein [Planctomycetes bacterium]|nr:tetratricopeptide repeat protein [Planctomycetota bacterium]
MDDGIQAYELMTSVLRGQTSMMCQTHANLLDSAKRSGEALYLRQRAVALEPASFTYNGLGDTLRKLRRHAEAADAYAAATRCDDQQAETFARWAGSLQQTGDDAQAIVHARAALALDGQHLLALRVLAYSLERTGETGEAVRAYEAVLRIDPDDHWARNRLEPLMQRVPGPLP